MNKTNWIFLVFVVLLAFGLVISAGCAKKEGEEQAEVPEIAAAEPAETEAEEAKVELPAAVAEVIDEYVPDAEIDFVEVVDEDGQTGEIEVDAEGNITEPLKWDEK